MYDVKETAERISTERLEAMLAGLDKLPHGPWFHGVADGPNGTDGLAQVDNGAEMWPIIAEWHEAAHIARCDPETIRSILTELLASRHADAQEGGEAASNELISLIGEYWDVAYAEGASDRTTDTPNGDAARIWSQIYNLIKTMEVNARALNPRKEAAAPSNPVVSDEMVERAIAAMVEATGAFYHPHPTTMRATLAAALSVNPQSGSE